MSEFHGDTEEYRHDHIQDESESEHENETLESDASDSKLEMHGIETREGTLRIIITKENMAKKQCSLIERIIYYVFFPGYFMRDLNEALWG